MKIKLKLKNVALLLCFSLLVLCGILGFTFAGNSTNTAYAATSTSAKCLTSGSWYTSDATSYVREGCPTSFYSIYMYSTNQNGTESTIENDTVLNWSYVYISIVPKNLDNHQTFTLTKDGATYTSKTLSGKSEMILYSGSLPSGNYVMSYAGDYDMGHFYKSKTYYYSYRFTIDVSAPTYTLKSGTSSISSGSYANQQITYSVSDSHPDRLYYKSPSSSSYYSTTSTSYSVSATASNNGWWYFYSTDAYGNTNSTVSAYLDTVKPVGTVTSNGSTIANGGYTNKSFYYTASDTGGVASYQVMKPNSSSWVSYTSGASLSGTNGWYTFRSTDKAGNVSDEYKVYYDSDAPTGTLYAGKTTASNGAYVNSSYIKYTASDSYSGVANCYVKKPGSTSYTCYTSGTQLTTEGTYYFYSVDRAGNASATVSITLDKTIPTGTITSNGAAVSSGARTSKSFSYSATDSGSGISTLYYKTPTHSSYQTYTAGSIISASSGDGFYYFYAVDRAGNQSATVSVYLDTTKPTLSLKGYTSGNSIANGAYTKERATFTASDTNFSRIYYKTPSASSYSYQTSTSYTTGMANGLYQVYAEDSAGNTSEVLSVYYDSVAPVGTITCNGQSIVSGSYLSKSFAYSATDSGSGVASLYYKSPTSGVYMQYTSGFVISDKSGDGWWYFYSVDNAGNQSAIMSVFLETQAPDIKIYRNDEVVFTKSLASSGTFDTDVYLNPNDKLKVTCDTPSGKVTSNYTLNSNITIGSSYTDGDYTITLTSATGITGNFTYHIVHSKPTISIDGKMYSSGNTLYFNSDKAVQFNDDSVIKNSGNTGARIKSEGNVILNELITYASGNGKTLTTASGTETKYTLILNDRAGNESVFTVFIDKLAPVGEWKADGAVLPNGGYTNKPLSFSISEAGVTAIYSYNGSEYATYTNGKTLTADGTYYIVLTDLAGNKSSFTAHIETGAPVGHIYAGNKLVNSGIVTNKTVFFSWDGDITATVNGAPYEKNDILTEDATYNFVLTDFAGNFTEYSITIDTQVPIYNTEKLTSSQQLISKWYSARIDGKDYSFATYDETLAFACVKEFDKCVTTFVLEKVEDFHQHHLVADGGEIRVGEYWLYKSKSNAESLLYYFNRDVLDEVIAYYAKENISAVNYFDNDGSNAYGEIAGSMNDNLLAASEKTKVPALNGFVFDKADGIQLYAELVGGGTRIAIEYGVAFDKQVSVGGLYKLTEVDEAGNEIEFYGFYDVISPALKVSATIIGKDDLTEFTITEKSLVGGAAFYYESFQVNEIVEADKWSVLSIRNGGKTSYYTYGDDLPYLNVGGEYSLTVYDRFGNGYSFTVYILGNPATIDFGNNSDDTAFGITITLEQKFDTLVSLEISKDGMAIDGVSTDTLSYTFDRAGIYTVTLRDNFGRTISKEYEFVKALPTGTFEGVEDGGKTKTDVVFSFDGKKFYAVVTKDGEYFATDTDGEIIVEANDENSGSYAIRLIRLTDEENFTDYGFIVNTLAPDFDLTVSDGATTNKNVGIFWSAEDIVSVVYLLNGGDAVTLNQGDVMTAEGFYTVTATNDLGTQTVKTFTIDKTLDYDIFVNNMQVAGVEATNDEVTVVNNEPLYVEVTKNGEAFEFEFGQVLTEEGAYNFRIYDDFNNATSFTVIIDKSVDVQANVGNGVISNEDVIILAVEKINFIATKDGVEYAYVLGTSIKDEGAYKFTIHDSYGNEKIILFQIVKGTKTKLDYTLGSNVEIKSIIRDGEAVSAASGNRLYFTVDGTYVVVCNSEGKEYTFTLALDTTAPTIKLNGIEDGGKGNVTVTITDMSEQGTIEVYKDGEQIEYNLGDELKEYGSYEVRVIDELGNERTYKFVLEYQMNGGAIALIIIGILLAVGVVIAIIFGKKAVYKRKFKNAPKLTDEELMQAEAEYAQNDDETDKDSSAE